MKIALSVVAICFVFGSVSASAPDEGPTFRPKAYPNITVRHEPAPRKAQVKRVSPDTPRTDLPQQPGKSPKGGVVIQLDATYRQHVCHPLDAPNQPALTESSAGTPLGD